MWESEVTSGTVNSLAITPDGKTAITAIGNVTKGQPGGSELASWELETGSKTKEIKLPENLYWLAFRLMETLL